MACRLASAKPLSEPMLEYRTLGTNFSEIFIEIYTFSFKKMYLNISSGNWRPFCLGLNELTYDTEIMMNEILRTLITDMYKNTDVFVM